MGESEQFVEERGETAAKARDVFISYGHADAAWVRTLAENLHQSSLTAFFDEWDIAPGDVLVHRLDAGILESRSGILVVSPESMRSKYVREEYAALMTRAIERGQRLIPVLLKDAELPPLLASRIWVDFRNADGPDYLARVDELVRALKGERTGPPPRTGVLNLPPGSGFKSAGIWSCRLTIAPDRCELAGDGVSAEGVPPDPGFDFDDLLWKLKRARAHWGPSRETVGAGVEGTELEGALAAIGERMAAALLAPEVAEALAAAVAEAERLNGTLQLALDVAEPFADLPWETLRLPHTQPLALHPRVELLRRIDTGGAAPAVAIPGPLRILVAIGSPEAQNARGELLDMEAELQRILDATERPRRDGKSFVHILEEGSVAAIHAALAERRYHVLHISCHAGPGVLILETAAGTEDKVTAERLWQEAMPAQRTAPLVVLAGCSTAQDPDPAKGAAAERLPGLARTLVARGVPAVIAMQAAVGDRYATELMGCVYEDLARWQEPRPLGALSHARRTMETRRRADTTALQPPPEWATPAFFSAAAPLRLYDPAAPFEELRETPAPVLDPGVVVRRIGDMVGRRREQRLIRHALRAPGGAGVLIHGIGGVGKSTLAAQILHRLTTDDGFLLVSLKGETDPDRVLSAIATRLLTLSLAQNADEKDPLRQIAAILREPKHSWRDRFEVLGQGLLAHIPVAFLFDNFEDNLTDGAVAEAELAALLARWLQAPGLSRLVFTCRYPFALPDDAQERLDAFHLGPLSWAETRKLLWRLDGLKALALDDQRRAYEAVGGHPRALEYLDAILRGGKAAFPDVTDRLRQQLKAHGIADPGRWCADTAHGFDAALAETVTLAADDVLLDRLLAQLEDDPLARRLLFAAAVYREPVDELGLIWQVAEPVEHAADPDRTARLQAMDERFKAAWGDVFAEAELAQYRVDFALENRPPVAAPAGFDRARLRLLSLSLLAPVRFADDDEINFIVHRWTAGALVRRAPEEDQAAAHRAAAAYWRWRAEKQVQARTQAIVDCLEARYHHHAAGDLAEVDTVTLMVVHQLDTWGAWEWEERLLRETLAWIPQGSQEAAGYLHQLGIVAQRRGDYDAALDWYRKSLAIAEQFGNRTGMASSYHQLGTVAQTRGDLHAALDWYRKSLAINEQLGDRAGMASSYGQLGNVAQDRGDDAAALEWTRQALAIFEQLGDRAGMAASLSQIGWLYTETGRAANAVPLNLQSLALRLQMQSPDVRIDLHWLSRQRQILGAEAFRAIVAAHLDADNTGTLLAALDEYDRRQQQPPSP